MNENYYEGLLQSMLNHFTANAQDSKQAMDAVQHIRNGKTVPEALAAITIINEHTEKLVRAFLYVVAIGGIIAATEKQHGITHEQAEDYMNYLREVGGFTS